jgi:hypothetical protein
VILRRGFRVGTTPANSRPGARLYAVATARPRRNPPMSGLVPDPASAAFVEEVEELVCFIHQARSSNAPLASGRYRR